MTGFAPGKVILFGEHAVVYGHRAIAVAIDRGTTVTLEARPGPSGAIPPHPKDPRLNPALRSLLPADGLGVRIDSALPVGRGLGSSAALAVALVRALAARDGREASTAECLDRALSVEKVFHGNPSGLDHTTCTLGGAVAFRRTGPEITPLPTPKLKLVILDSGQTGDTAKLVADVASRRPRIDGTLSAIGEVVEEAANSLEHPTRLGALMLQNHHLLSDIGVSTPQLDRLVDLAMDAGALGAKLAGAGGGGVVLALASNVQPILDSATRAGVHAFSVGIHPAG